ncbi:hypothetical protein SSBR45G_41980 [Bradyrhizobium sp. SSBR45G]|uniref:hypothetical protein n=1 Tax=unclassified Bradyrhizobium TaxID=2631580 RepID=UPI002342A868|nr:MULTISPECIES: hypothetical protein [unclassified Bradyrhizobium]GLH79289.1 hypothetical protein SSBR45G_41980 [Bradyrhizobium sp. SSBR45G]GLH86775.1 hypothetical protein SSBR45R_42350 [Bradyrhizobium sp. SSBR45R]
MRTLIAAVLIGLMAWPASAQMGGGRRSPSAEKGSQPAKPQVDEKAYKAALDRIPESKEKYDPWSGARPTAPEKKPK